MGWLRDQLGRLGVALQKLLAILIAAAAMVTLMLLSVTAAGDGLCRWAKDPVPRALGLDCAVPQSPPNFDYILPTNDSVEHIIHNYLDQTEVIKEIIRMTDQVFDDPVWEEPQWYLPEFEALRDASIGDLTQAKALQEDMTDLTNTWKAFLSAAFDVVQHQVQDAQKAEGWPRKLVSSRIATGIDSTAAGAKRWGFRRVGSLIEYMLPNRKETDAYACSLAEVTINNTLALYDKTLSLDKQGSDLAIKLKETKAATEQMMYGTGSPEWRKNVLEENQQSRSDRYSCLAKNIALSDCPSEQKVMEKLRPIHDLAVRAIASIESGMIINNYIRKNLALSCKRFHAVQRYKGCIITAPCSMNTLDVGQVRLPKARVWSTSRRWLAELSQAGTVVGLTRPALGAATDTSRGL